MSHDENNQPILSQSALRLVKAREEIDNRPAEIDDTAFVSRQLLQVALPHSNPGNVPYFSRTNGFYTVHVERGQKPGGKLHGYPYGPVPRMIYFWLSTEAIKKGSPKLVLGSTLAEFMRDVGYSTYTGGGVRSDYARVKVQAENLIRSRITFFKNNDESGDNYAFDDVRFVSKGDLWWNAKVPDQTSFLESWIELSPEFFKLVTSNPVPLDKRILRALKKSPFMLDLYSWVTYKQFIVCRKGRKAFISFGAMQRQMGANMDNYRMFRKRAKDYLSRINLVYEGLSYEVSEDQKGIWLLPNGRPSIAPKDQQLFI